MAAIHRDRLSRRPVLPLNQILHLPRPYIRFSLVIVGPAETTIDHPHRHAILLCSLLTRVA